MDVIIKSFIGIFCMLLVVSMGMGITGMAVAIRNADTFASTCVQRIEASNGAQSVVAACKKDAADYGYELEVTMHQAPESTRATYGNMTLTYHYGLAFLGIERTRSIVADLLY